MSESPRRLHPSAGTVAENRRRSEGAREAAAAAEGAEPRRASDTAARSLPRRSVRYFLLRFLKICLQNSVKQVNLI